MFNSKQSKFGALSVAFTLIFIFVTVVVNVIAGLVVDKFSIKVDLTANKKYSLSEEAIKFVKDLKSDVSIYVLTTEANWKSGSADNSLIMERILASSSKLKISYIDLNQNPNFLTSKDKTLTYDTQKVGALFFEGTKRNKLVYNEDLYDTTNYQQTGVAESKLEQEIISALMFVTAENIDQVMFTKGHGEADNSALADILKTNNFTTESVSLATENISNSAKYVAILAPSNDFTDAEISKLDSFLTNGKKYGKNLLVFFGAEKILPPKLNAFLSEWGLKANSDMVLDDKYAVQQASNIIIQVSNDAVGKSIKDKEIYLIAPFSSSIEILFDAKDIRKTQKLLSTYDNARAILLSDKSEDAFSKAPKGTKIIMAMSSKTEYVDNAPVTSNLVACGSVDFSTISQKDFGNAEYMISLLNYLRGGENKISISPKTITDEPLSKLNILDTFIIAIIFIVLIPVIIIIFGIITWRRRKNL
jgi:ABC-2 type transport system permease protein